MFSIVRKAHNSGRNHLANVRDYYACKCLLFHPYPSIIIFSFYLALGHDKAQSIIDQITSSYESGGPPSGGFGFGGPFMPPPFGGMPPRTYTPQYAI